MDKIVNKYAHSIDRYTAVRYMVDCQFDTTFLWMSFNCSIYICLFMVPFLLQIFIFGENAAGVYICNALCLTTQIYFMCLEIIQMQEAGFLDYISDTFNKVDLGMFLTYCYYFMRRMSDQTDPLVPSLHYADPTKDPNTYEENTAVLSSEAVQRVFVLSVLHNIIIVQAFVKVMFYLRISEGFGLLVDCVSNCIEACIPFTGFLTLWMVLFAILFRV